MPHGYPFLLVDAISEVIAGEKGVGLKICLLRTFFQGHFPGAAGYAGCAHYGTLAQVGAVAVLSKEEFKGKLALLRGFNNVHFRGVVCPGDTLHLEVMLTGIRGRAGKGKGRASVDGRVVASGEVSFAIVDNTGAASAPSKES